MPTEDKNAYFPLSPHPMHDTAHASDQNKETATAVFFFTPAFAGLDPFSAHAVALWGHTFPTAEHAYQWKKLADYTDIAAAVLAAPSPWAVKSISDQHKDKYPPRWQEEKAAVMEEIFRAKAAQHADVHNALHRTGNKTIVENSPVDSYWGAGPDGQGHNMMGKIWMRIRDGL